MNVIIHNDDKTIGVITDPDNIITIGHFTPALLKEWSEKAIEIFGEGHGPEGGIPVHFRVSDNGCCSALYIGDPDENMYVMVAGRAKDDAPKE